MPSTRQVSRFYSIFIVLSVRTNIYLKNFNLHVSNRSFSLPRLRCSFICVWFQSDSDQLYDQMCSPLKCHFLFEPLAAAQLHVFKSFQPLIIIYGGWFYITCKNKCSSFYISKMNLSWSVVVLQKAWNWNLWTLYCFHYVICDMWHSSGFKPWKGIPYWPFPLF